jgi:hypothetical protein
MREQKPRGRGALQELSHLILLAGLTLAVVAREKASPLDGRARVRFTPVSGRLAAKSWSLLWARSSHLGFGAKNGIAY